MEMIRISAPIIRIPEKIDESENPSEYVVRVSFSSPEEDLHFTRMCPETTLKNFLAEAEEGRMVCYNHVKECPMGITSNSSQDKNGITYCDFNIDRDLPLQNSRVGFPNSEQIIRQIHNKRITKTSIGGVGGDLICNICEKSMISWSLDACWDHWPGETATIDDPNDKNKKITVRCSPSWVDLHLAEISAVWSGSNLQSEILKTRAENMLESGSLKKDLAIRLNGKYNYQLDVSRAKPDKSIFDLGGAPQPKKEEDKMPTQEEFDALKAEKEKAEQERDALKGDSEALEREVADVRKECVQKYKEFRGENLTGDSLKEFENMISTMQLHELKVQRDILIINSSDAADTPKVEPGQAANASPDNSKHEDEPEKHPQGWGLPSFFRTALEQTGTDKTGEGGNA